MVRIGETLVHIFSGCRCNAYDLILSENVNAWDKKGNKLLTNAVSKYDKY